MEDLAVVCGIHACGEDLEKCILGIVGADAGCVCACGENVAFVGGLAASLWVEDGVFCHEDEVIVAGGFEEGFVGFFEGGEWLDGLDGCFEVEEFGVVLVGETRGGECWRKHCRLNGGRF